MSAPNSLKTILEHYADTYNLTRKQREFLVDMVLFEDLKTISETKGLSYESLKRRMNGMLRKIDSSPKNRATLLKHIIFHMISIGVIKP